MSLTKVLSLEAIHPASTTITNKRELGLSKVTSGSDKFF